MRILQFDLFRYYSAAADPFLTALGEDQARNANAAWKAELSKGIPLPQKLYSSPMRRAMRTLVFTFDGILTETSPKPVVIEVYHAVWLTSIVVTILLRNDRTGARSTENTPATSAGRVRRSTPNSLTSSSRMDSWNMMYFGRPSVRRKPT